MVQSSRVMLTDEQRADLRTRIGAGGTPAHQVTRARILLKTDHRDAGPPGSLLIAHADARASRILREMEGVEGLEVSDSGWSITLEC